MGTLSSLKPANVFNYFEELTKIPHGSYNIDKISDYIASFGRSLGLETYQDELKNVIIIKEASKGYEAEPPIILQGHMDMVAVARPELSIDMKKEGLKVAVNEAEDYIYAEGTSLGGDDGIAVAYAMAILSDDSLSHPRLEVVITTNEETGMEGASGIDLSMLKGSRLLNLDSEEEGIFLTSCAGGLRARYAFAATPVSASGMLYEIKIGGLLGGHSGEEIIKGRANSNKLAARLLSSIRKSIDSLFYGENNTMVSVYITHIEGGTADNAIPRETSLGIIIPESSSSSSSAAATASSSAAASSSASSSSSSSSAAIASIHDVIADTIEAFTSDVKNEYHTKDPDFYCKIISARQVAKEAAYRLENAITFLDLAPDGVMAMSGDVPGLVETSLNLGIVKFPCDTPFESGVPSDKAAASATMTDSAVPGTNSKYLRAAFCVRSSIESAKAALTNRLSDLAGLCGGSSEISGNYPGWAYRAESPLREKMIALYERMYKKKPSVQAIHAGLECGLLGSKIQNLDCVSIGPDMQSIHTTEEKLSISSTARVYDYVVSLLALKD